jgi:deoxycytidylate deaminase
MGNVKFLSQAVNLASQSEHRSFKHGAILVKGGKVLSEGVNKYTIGTHGLHAHSEHAEENALAQEKIRIRKHNVHRTSSFVRTCDVEAMPSMSNSFKECRG